MQKREGPLRGPVGHSIRDPPLTRWVCAKIRRAPHLAAPVATAIALLYNGRASGFLSGLWRPLRGRQYFESGLEVIERSLKIPEKL